METLYLSARFARLKNLRRVHGAAAAAASRVFLYVEDPSEDLSLRVQCSPCERVVLRLQQLCMRGGDARACSFFGIRATKLQFMRRRL